MRLEEYWVDVNSSIKMRNDYDAFEYNMENVTNTKKYVVITDENTHKLYQTQSARDIPRRLDIS